MKKKGMIGIRLLCGMLAVCLLILGTSCREAYAKGGSILEEVYEIDDVD